MATDLSDAELVRQARGGETAGWAFGQLVHRYLKHAMAVAWEFTGNRADAEDVVQDAFRRVFRSLGGFDPARPFPPWLYGIVRNSARSLLKSRPARSPERLSEDLPDRGPAPDRAAQRHELRRAIIRAVNQLPAMQRSCFQLCVVEGMTSPETAAALGIAEPTVRVHLFRAKRALRELLAEWA